VIVALRSGNIQRRMNSSLKLQPQSPGICRVLTSAGAHVGNLKLIGDVWKFKAIGYDDAGQVVPGGGPLTEKHNTTFVALDEVQVNFGLTANRAF
jgi:hypothetical protein